VVKVSRPLTAGDPTTAGLANEPMFRLDDDLKGLVGDAVPGAVVLIARHGIIAKAGAFGYAQTHEQGVTLDPRRRMRVDTVFDVASITKVAATTAALMRLVDDGLIRLDEQVRTFLPEFAGAQKAKITVRDLLTHRAGLSQWQPLYLWAQGPADALRLAASLPLTTQPKKERRYSDLGFMLLGEIVQRVVQETLDSYAQRVMYGPLGMEDTNFMPLDRSRVAATSDGNPIEFQMIVEGSPEPVRGMPQAYDRWRRHTLVGEVNDGNAFYAFDGVAGHAGLFSTAPDLAAFGQALLSGGGHDSYRIWSSAAVAQFTRPQIDRCQGLGFWTQRLPRLPGLRPGGFGHRGFTGCELAVAPEHDLIVVLLTNRLHSREAAVPDIQPIWHQVLRRVGEAMMP
jgi:CubicO group peptidase (beta-lactamase class C family)